MDGLLLCRHLIIMDAIHSVCLLMLVNLDVGSSLVRDSMKQDRRASRLKSAHELLPAPRGGRGGVAGVCRD